MKKLAILMVSLVLFLTPLTAFAGASDFLFTLKSRSGDKNAYVYSDEGAQKETDRAYAGIRVNSFTPQVKKNVRTCLVLYGDNKQATDSIWYSATSRSYQPAKFLSGKGVKNTYYSVAMRLNDTEAGSGSIDVSGRFTCDTTLTY